MLAALLLSGLSLAAIADRVAAVVNGDVITLSEVYELGGPTFIEPRASSDATRRAAELEVLDSLVLRRLISQEIERLGLDVTDIELDRTVDDIANRNGMTREQLRREVEKSGLPWSEYRGELKEELRMAKFNQAIIQPRITVNEDELKDAYRRLLASADLPEIVELGAIFMAAPTDPEVPDPRTAELQARADAGEPFPSLAAEYDQGPYGAAGGKMGNYREGELMPLLNDPAFALDVGTLSEPIQTNQGIFFLYVFERYPEQPPELEAVRNELMEQVYSDRIEEETDTWFQQTRRRSAILIKLEGLD
ncbi:MAG: peptidyl-prolyl cis-trans isomerase SurA [Myxococcota bacterium]|jgi:peptidyl-prolyl cis-trans isomerase SurA